MPETYDIGEEPTTFEQRKEAAVNVLADLAKWCHCNHTREEISDGIKNPDVGGVHSFNGEVESAIRRGHVPDIGPNTFGDFDTYGWQIFCQTIAQSVMLDRETVAQRRDELVRKLETGDGEPRASDGSKGQWRASLRSQIQTFKWLLCEEDGNA